MSAIIRQRSGVILISLRSQLGRTTSGPTGEEIPSTGATGDAALPLGKAVQSNNENRDRTVRNGESMRQITLMIKWLEVESGYRGTTESASNINRICAASSEREQWTRGLFWRDREIRRR